MQNRLDPGSKALAAQDFRHTVQSHKESVSDFICRLEQVFRRAYGKEQISTETRDTLLRGQLQEGLSDVLIRAPAVSGALTYQGLCVAAKNEEDRKICAGGTSTAKMKMPRLHQGAMHTRVFEGDHKQTGEADQL